MPCSATLVRPPRVFSCTDRTTIAAPVAVGAAFELGERPRGELEGLGEDGCRRVREQAVVERERIPRRLPAVEDPFVAGAGGQQLRPPRLEGQRPGSVSRQGAELAVEPAQEQRASGRGLGDVFVPGAAGLRCRAEPGQRVRRVVRVGRAQAQAAVRGAFGEGVGRAIGIPTQLQRRHHRRIVEEVVADEDQHQQVGAQRPRVLVMERQLVGLPGALASPRLGGDVQLRQRGGGERLEAHVQLVGDPHLARLHERVAEDGDVAARRGARRVGRLAVEEAEAVGAGDRPVVGAVDAHIGVRLVEHAHSRHEARGRDGFEEG